MLASKLGLSIATVSRALRHPESISRKTRHRVIEAARELGYVSYARQSSAQRQDRSRQVIALASLDSPMTDQRYRTGMQRASILMNVSILSHHLTRNECENMLDPALQPYPMKAGLVDGIILIHSWPPAVAEQLAEKWPTVSMICHYPAAQMDYVGIDECDGMTKIVSHLKATGCRHPGFFGFCGENGWSRARFAAFIECLYTHELDFDPAAVITLPLTESLTPAPLAEGSWVDRAAALTRSGVDSWVCASMPLGQTLCASLIERGIRIPDDVSLIACHKNGMQVPHLPELTCTVVPDEELGAAAIRRLMHRLEGESDPYRCVLFSTRLSQGETTRTEPSA